MAKHRATGDDQLTRQGVIETPDPAYWSVDDSRWPVVRPDLPAHLVDLLAPPIVVGVARVPVTSRLTPPTPPTIRPTAESAIITRKNIPKILLYVSNSWSCVMIAKLLSAAGRRARR